MSTFLRALEVAAGQSEVRQRAEETLRAEYEQFKARAEAAEQECVRLRQEIEDVGASLRKVLTEIRQPAGAATRSTPAPAGGESAGS